MQTEQITILPKILPVVGYGSPILKEVCLEVEKNMVSELLIKDLLHTMKSIGTAVGLAAPQVNYKKNMFVMRPNGKDIVVINPVIKSKGGVVKSTEGCLSIPGLEGTVPDRNEVLDVEYYDENFNKQKTRLRGFEAIVFQHEYDHLMGILYTDRLTKIGREEIADKLADIEKGNHKAVYDMIFTNV